MKPKTTKEAFIELNKAFYNFGKSIDLSIGATDKINKTLTKANRKIKRLERKNRFLKTLRELGAAAKWAIFH